MSFILTDSKQRKRILGMALATVLATSAFAAPVTSAFATESDPTTTITSPAPSASDATLKSYDFDLKKVAQHNNATKDRVLGIVATTGKAPTAILNDGKSDHHTVASEYVTVEPGIYEITYSNADTVKGVKVAFGTAYDKSEVDGDIFGASNTAKTTSIAVSVAGYKPTTAGDKAVEKQTVELPEGAFINMTGADNSGILHLQQTKSFVSTTTPDKPAAGVIESTGTDADTASSFKIAAGDYTAKWDAKDDKAADLTVRIFKTTKTRSATDGSTPDYIGTAKADGAVTWTDKDGKTVDHVTIADDDWIAVIGVGTVTFEAYKATTPDPDQKPEAKTYTFNADADTPFLGTLDQKGLTEGNYVVGVIPNAKDGSVTATIGEPGEDGKFATPVYTITYEAGSAGKKFTVHRVADNVDSTNQVIYLNPSYVLDLQGGSLTFTSTTDHESWNGGADGDESLKPIKTVDIDLTKVEDANGDGSAILGVVPQAEGDKLPSYVAPSDDSSKDDSSKDDSASKDDTSKDDSAKARVIAETPDTTKPDTSDPTVKPEEKPDTTKKAGTYADQFQALEPGIYQVTFTASKSELAKKSVTGAWFDKAETKDGVFNAAEGAKSTPLEVFDATLKADESSPVVETLNLTKGGVLYLNGGADSGTVHLSLMKKAEETPKPEEKPAGDKLANTGVGVIASVLGISALSGAGAGAELLRRKRRGE